VDKLALEIQAVMKDPAIVEAFTKVDTIPVGNTPREFRAFIDAETERGGTSSASSASPRSSRHASQESRRARVEAGRPDGVDRSLFRNNETGGRSSVVRLVKGARVPRHAHMGTRKSWCSRGS
jgi:hypothetical protein